MSDRPEESRPASETGGWFVPKNAMNEQQMAASAADKQGAANEAPMPSATPTQEGGWHAAGPAAPVAASSSEPASPAQPAAQPGTPLPKGAEISTDADYSNYVPGKGFVAPGTASTSDAADMAATPDASDAPPAAEPSAEPVADAAPMSAQVAAPASAASGAGVPVVAQDTPVEPAKPVNPELVKRYADVEKSVQVLRRRYSAGTLTRGQLQDELRKLMILDEDGYWWMIGLESDRWYKYNGSDWVQPARPGQAADAQTAAPA